MSEQMPELPLSQPHAMLSTMYRIRAFEEKVDELFMRGEINVVGQSAILAVGKMTKRGVVIEDGNTVRLEIRPVMKLSLSADHRVLDGASGSRFLHQLKVFLEDLYLLL